MTAADPAGGGEGAAPPANPVLVLHQEQASVVNEWVPASRVRLSRRIVTEIQTIDVEVRREELVVTTEALPADDVVALPAGQAPLPPEPLVFVLRAEVPSVSLTIRPVERVTVTPRVVDGERDLDVVLRSEHVTLHHVGTD